MQRFAALYARLDQTASILAKRAALADYLREAPPADAAWGLYLLLGRTIRRPVPGPRLRLWAAEATGFSSELIEDSYAQVGDLAELLTLLFDNFPRKPAPEQSLAAWVAFAKALAGLLEAEQKAKLFAAWEELDVAQGYILNKILTGSLRVGVSEGLAAQAAAEVAGIEASSAAQRLMGEWEPTPAFVSALLSGSVPVVDAARPYPFFLASPLEAAPDTLGPVTDWLAEWKWDGIRGQLIRRAGQTFLWSRGEDLLDGRFPEIETAAQGLPDGTVLDGEILAMAPGPAGAVLPFATLQKRIGRKSPGKKTLADAPAGFIAYDLVEWAGEDWRERPLTERRAQLQRLLADGPYRVSESVDATSWEALAEKRAESRTRGVEGLMLKKLDSPYLAGRRRGTWWKWKTEALSLDMVLLYAQAGHGRRANLYTDYTLAVWSGDALVPVAKAYSGLTDVELASMDRWIRAHTREKFGPVRSVDPVKVFEIAFEGINRSTRHKAGVAVRFPRILRMRPDKPAAEANRLEDLQALLEAHPETVVEG